MSDQPERMWSTDRDQQLKMQRLYLYALQAKKMDYAQAQTYMYAAFLTINQSGNPLPSHKAQLVFEIAAQE
jgi:hypothetical protein